MKPVVGFLGNTIGLSDAQQKSLHTLLDSMDIDLIRHSNASGAERDAHYIFLCGTGAKIEVHEPLEYYGRAMVSPIEPRVTAHVCNSSLDASAAVIGQSDIIIFAPVDHTKKEMQKLLGGVKKGQMQVYASIVCRTEPLVRTAANLNKKIIILREDGQVIRYE